MTRVGEMIGLVLAAGNSTRMGEGRNKLLERVGGRPLVCWPVAALREAGVSRVVAVLGFEAEAVETVLGDDVDCVRAEDWSAGMGASLAAGARAIATRTRPTALLVCVGDLPGLRAATVSRVVESYDAEPDDARICVPSFEGRYGHPVLFGAGHLAALTRLGGDVGARALLTAHPEQVRRVELATASILRDVDSPADLTEGWD